PPGLVPGRDGTVPRGRGPDPDRGGDGLRVRDRGAVDERCRARGLHAHHPGTRGDDALGVVLAVALPVRRDVAGVTDGQEMQIGRAAEHVDDLESGRLLPLDTHRVDRVDQTDLRVGGGGLAGQFEAVVEVAVDLDDRRAVHDRLGQLARRDLALRDEDRAAHPGARGVRRRGGRGTSGRGAQHRLLPPCTRVGHRHRHPAVFERPGRVEPLHLQVDVTAGDPGEVVRRDERGAALVQGHGLPVVPDRQPVAIGLDETGPTAVHGLMGVAHSVSIPSSRMTLVTSVTASWSVSADTVSARARSEARCVRTVSSAVGSASSPAPSGVSASVWRTWAIDTPWLENSAATSARTPGLSATRIRTWYRVATSSIEATWSAA